MTPCRRQAAEWGRRTRTKDAGVLDGSNHRDDAAVAVDDDALQRWQKAGRPSDTFYGVLRPREREREGERAFEYHFLCENVKRETNRHVGEREDSTGLRE